MGYSSVRHRQLVQGRVADRPYEVDLLGVRGRFSMRLFQTVGLAMMIFSAVLFLGVLPQVRLWLREALMLIHPVLAGFTLLLLGALGFVLGYLGRQRYAVHAWVECKAHQGTVRREHVQKLILSVDDVRKREDNGWSPDEVILVSENGFDVDAVNFARAYDIRCYRRLGKGFERVT